MYKTAFKFLLISFPGRSIYEWWAPVILSMAVTIASIFFPEIALAGANGILSKLSSVLPVVGGFFVASLAVVLSQTQGRITDGFSGTVKPKILREDEPLTRQRFLALLFGYLAFSSFFNLAIIYSIDIIRPVLSSRLNVVIYNILKRGLLFAILTWCFQIGAIMLIGLHYLSDRLYRSDKKAYFKRELPPAE